MHLSEKDSHSSSDDHKNKTEQLFVWCEDCGKYISDITRHFQSEIHLQEIQHQEQDTRSCVQSISGVKVIVNEKTYEN